MKIKRILSLCISILTICLIIPGNNSVKSSFNDDNTLLPSFKFNVGSKIVTITEHFKPKTGDIDLEFPVIRKVVNEVPEYFISEGDIYTIFNLSGYNIMFIADKEYETYWFAPNNSKYIHFKWIKNDKGYKVFEEPFIGEVQAKWGILP
jgi:hypothetical protein